MKIRRATERDLDAIAALYVDLSQHHAPLAPGQPRYGLADHAWGEHAARALSDPANRFYVAVEGGRVIGFVKFSFERKPWGRSCEVDTLVVEQARRGSGVGSALMDRAEEVAREEGSLGMRVNVLHTNEDGRRFYERSGYRPFAVRYGKPL